MSVKNRTNNLKDLIPARGKVKLPYSLGMHQSTRQGKRPEGLKSGRITPKNPSNRKNKNLPF
jgi:hypothetical protein